MSEHQSIESWQPCEPGELAALARKIAVERRREFLIRTGRIVVPAAAAVGAILFCLSWSANRDQSSPKPRRFLGPMYGGIACGEVVHLARAFLAGSLPEEKMARIRRHLELCSTCRATVSELEVELRQEVIL